MKDNYIEIFRASAGSGKTFTLTKEYLELLFGSDDIHAYRHILAVTFTNKATEEMKNRILEDLAVLAGRTIYDINGKVKKNTSPYAEDLKRMRSWNDSRLKEEAEKRLLALMHDYPAFSVSTIDKFFQMTLKAFAKECGKTPSYQVELKKEAVVEESVDRLLDSLYTEESGDKIKDAENRTLLEWLSKNVLLKIAGGEKYKSDAYLMEKAKRLINPQREEAFVEYCRLHPDFDPEAFYSESALTSLQKSCDDYIAGYEKSVMDMTEKLLREFKRCGTDVSETKYLTARSKKSLMASFTETYGKLTASGGGDWKFEPNIFHGEKIEPLSDSLLKNVSKGVENWYKELPSLPADNQLYGYALALCGKLSGDEYRRYATVHMIASQIYSIGLTDRIQRNYNQLMADNNILCLDDSNKLLKDIIDGAEAPLVYEKIGVRFNHFLLDEFQDTAGIQWENFKPLVGENTSYGGKSLIVGDEKQSIYRFRDSDWKLLQSKVKEDLTAMHRGVEESSLDSNYRSLSSVVNFNNNFFKAVASIVDLVDYGNEKDAVSSLYTHVWQKVPSKTNMSQHRGMVEISFVSSGGNNDLTRLYQCRRVLDIIEDLRQNHDASLSDIAVLVRENKEGENVANFLTGHGYNVITNDSMNVKSSYVVNQLSLLLGYMDNSYDTVCKFAAQKVVDRYVELHPVECGIFAGELTLADILPPSYTSLIELTEQLFALLKEQVPMEQWRGETLYIQSFMDAIKDYVSRNGNCLHGFLKHWNEINPSISSVKTENAIQIVTVHKSKGLAFPYVILPFVENMKLYNEKKPSRRWCPLDEEIEVAPGVKLRGIYDLTMRGGLEDTFFASSYDREVKLMHIDNLNILYVALTRAAKGLHIISACPSRNFFDKFFNKTASETRNLAEWQGYIKYDSKGRVVEDANGNPEYFVPGEYVKDFSVMFYWFARWGLTHPLETQSADYKGYVKCTTFDASISEADCNDYFPGLVSKLSAKLKEGESMEKFTSYSVDCFSFGEKTLAGEEYAPFGFKAGVQEEGMTADNGAVHEKKALQELILEDPLPVIPLNPVRSRFESASMESSQVGAEKKEKLRGRLKMTDEAVDFFRSLDSLEPSARARGIALHDMMAEVFYAEDVTDELNFAKAAIERHPEWVPPKASGVKVYNEVDYVYDGVVLRPDRVVECPDKLIVIDYKFGSYHKEYEKQLAKYMDLWRKLTGKKVEGYLWYMNGDENDELLASKLDGKDYIAVKP